jgi:hypothetical protein
MKMKINSSDFHVRPGRYALLLVFQGMDAPGGN